MDGSNVRIPIGQSGRYRQYTSQYLRNPRSHHTRTPNVVGQSIIASEGLRRGERGKSGPCPSNFQAFKRSSIHGMLVIRTTLTSTAVREAVDGDGDGVVRKRLTQDTHDRALEITVRRGRSARLRCHVERYGGFKEDR